ncbi:MAG: FAD:protein FMN transferase [Nitrospirae bacterium]|nr:FAD:protein FMN transferase [Nitrospirota bacterium]
MPDSFRIAQTMTFSRVRMGSRLEITLVHVDRDHGRNAASAAFDEVQRLERLLSAFQPDSELSRLNRLAGSGPVTTTPELVDLLEEAERIARLSHGAFNVAAQPGRPIGMPSLLVDRTRSAIEYRAPAARMDLGAIGKGYAIDRAVGALQRHGITDALVDFGSTAYGLGSAPRRDQERETATGWRMAIRHPHDPNQTMGLILLKNGALSTSGGYEQPGHLIDPRSGRAAMGTLSASVIASTAAASDAWSTAAFVLGPAAGRTLLEQQKGIEGFFLHESRPGRVTITQTAGWPAEPPRPAVTRRQFLAAAMALAVWLAWPASRSQAIVYATPEEALKRLLPDADTVREESVTLTDQQKQAVEQLIDTRIKEERYTVWHASRDGGSIGTAVQVEVTGKERPITFLIAVSPERAVLGIEVLIYRESQGHEIRSGRFMKQFAGKTLAAPLKLGKDIDAISGATLSSRATTYAAKKALGLVQVITAPHTETSS